LRLPILLGEPLAAEGGPMTVIGVDLGLAGAIALVEDGGELGDVFDMPCLADGPRGRRMINAPLLAEIIVKAHASSAFIEHVGVRPQEGEDDIAGCLRVATGGSSRQSWLRIEDGRIRRRVMTGREAARLMGLPDAFRPPRNENEALTAIGDGVAVPVVRFLTAHLLEPLLGERGR
jgi:hypothetical protein